MGGRREEGGGGFAAPISERRGGKGVWARTPLSTL